MTTFIAGRQPIGRSIARAFLSLAWAAFAATQCRVLPRDVETGVANYLFEDAKGDRS